MRLRKSTCVPITHSKQWHNKREQSIEKVRTVNLAPRAHSTLAKSVGLDMTDKKKIIVIMEEGVVKTADGVCTKKDVSEDPIVDSNILTMHPLFRRQASKKTTRN